ncbi:hypothetical protein BH11VER1_BH11VER1_40190 [soil metagenome]
MSAPKNKPQWEKLPSLPDPEGFAGPFAGVSGGALIVAGGANITGDKWADPLTKKWYDSVFVLKPSDAMWITGHKLPRPLGYGISITADDSVLCFGGSDADRHYVDGFRLHWKNETLDISTLPSLPKPCANACAAFMGRTIYVAGGIETPTATEAMHTFWALDLDAVNPQWKALEPWPGPARMLAVAGVFEGSFYLFSGAKLSAGPDGKPLREFLRDAYRFTPGEGWKKLTSLPRAAVAAPSPAPLVDGRLLVFSGDDGLNTSFQPLTQHPGFPRQALAYDPAQDTWSAGETFPFSRVTAPIVRWQNQLVIPNGEVRPRLRTPEVLSLALP